MLARKQHIMKRLSLLAVLTATFVTGALVAANVAPLQAQGGPGGPGGGMRNSPKGRIGRLMMGIGMLEAEKKAPLSATQAKTIVLAIKPWQAKKTMTDDQAKALYMSINGALTTKQKNELDKESAKNRRFGPGREGGDRPRGGGGGQMPDASKMAEMRARMQKMTGFFKTYNPFYPPSSYAEFKSAPERMQEGMTKRYQRQTQLLQALAKKGGVKL